MSGRFPMTFALNRTEYTGLYILNYDIQLEVLDSEGTGRSRAWGWPLIRDPQGSLVNLFLTVGVYDGAPASANEHFRHLWQTCKSMGREEFAHVRFVDPLAEVLEQNMYCVAARLRYRRITQDGHVFTDPLQISFIAETGE